MCSFDGYSDNLKNQAKVVHVSIAGCETYDFCATVLVSKASGTTNFTVSTPIVRGEATVSGFGPGYLANELTTIAVSYTHLTLPTILRV